MQLKRLSSSGTLVSCGPDCWLCVYSGQENVVFFHSVFLIVKGWPSMCCLFPHDILGGIWDRIDCVSY